MKKHYFGGWMVVCSVGGLSLAALTGCGQGFGSTGCQATHTCAGPIADDAAGAPAATDPTSGGAGSHVGEPGPVAEGGAPSATPGGAASGGTPPNGGTPTNGGATASAGDDSGAGTSDLGGAGAGGAGETPDPNPPPTVIAVSPTNKSKNADPDTTIVLTFSEPLDAATVTRDNIKIFDGATEIVGKLTCADGKVTFAPAVPLYMLESYKVSVGVGVTDAAGAPLLNPYSSTFTTRDGAWKTVEVAAGTLTEVSDSLPISATGNALVAWGVMGDKVGCPVSARWFRRSEGNGAVQAFDATDNDCGGVTAGGNALGIGSVVWAVPDASHGELGQQFRADAWQARPSIISSATNLGDFRVGVSPTGMVTLIAQNTAGGTTAWRTDANGKWIAQGDKLSIDKPFSPANIAFDASGNGLAVWSAETATHRTEILSSRYTAASGKWSAATAIPDSLANNPNAGAIDHAPSLAMTPDGDAMAVWIQTLSDVGDRVNTSIFSRVSGWAADSYEIMPYLTDTGHDAPGVTYDGQGFAVAWVARPIDPPAGVLCTNFECTYTNRYDLKLGKWGSTATQQTTEADLAVPHMPGLVSDGRGNLMLVWEKYGPGSDKYTLLYQRLINGKWSAIAAVAGGVVDDYDLSRKPPALSMNASGMAALSWGNYNSNNLITSIQLASFY